MRHRGLGDKREPCIVRMAEVLFITEGGNWYSEAAGTNMALQIRTQDEYRSVSGYYKSRYQPHGVQPDRSDKSQTDRGSDMKPTLPMEILGTTSPLPGPARHGCRRLQWTSVARNYLQRRIRPELKACAADSEGSVSATRHWLATQLSKKCIRKGVHL